MALQLGREQPFDFDGPLALRAAVANGPRRHAAAGPSFDRRERPDPGAHAEPAQYADESREIAARAGRAGEIELAGLRLMPVPRNRKLYRTDADRLQPHQLALP